PERCDLGDNDESQWPTGIDGSTPLDPWQHQICVVLQKRETGEFYTFVTSSVTGRRACGQLLRHYDRMRRTNPDEWPLIKLKTGGFAHRDERIGWVSTPAFAVVGRIRRTRRQCQTCRQQISMMACLGCRERNHRAACARCAGRSLHSPNLGTRLLPPTP